MKYAIDRIENSIAILENLDTKERKEVNIKDLPSSIKEGNILSYENNTYIINQDEELIRRKRILDKFNKLKK